MSRPAFQKRRAQGRNQPVFPGLAAEVHRVLSGLYNVESVTCAGVGKYQGEPKVKIPARWREKRCIPISVCDGNLGERKLLVRTTKPGAIARILRKRLLSDGHTVCTTYLQAVT